MITIVTGLIAVLLIYLAVTDRLNTFWSAMVDPMGKKTPTDEKKDQ